MWGCGSGWCGRGWWFGRGRRGGGFLEVFRRGGGVGGGVVWISVGKLLWLDIWDRRVGDGGQDATIQRIEASGEEIAYRGHCVCGNGAVGYG